MGADCYPVLNGADHPIRLYDDMNGEAVEIIPDLPRVAVSGHAAVIEEWVKNLDQPEAPIPAWQGAMTAQIIEAAYKSAETGEMIKL